MKNKPNIDQEVKPMSENKIRRRNFISFTAFIGLNALFFGAWKWLNNSEVEKRTATAGTKQPLRKILDANEKVFHKTFSHDHLVKTYPRSMAARNVRVNSRIGMRADDTQPENWMLLVQKNDGSEINVNLNDLRALPKTDIVYDFKCVEGWDQISWWAGVKFADFMEHYGLADEAKMKYTGLLTPDKGYYVGLDMESALHPQTILAYEVNGQPLPYLHGKPLRLIIPVKYGIKNLKRIGSINFSNERPPDYWAERGYDYYSGL
jgi:DMSO/TMAO reductase YedYZ molybdopterin-dependent catalytic subunit